ncbi:L-fucose dehydrogenase [Pedobacter chitinilyticus]|uniref:SDR family oxidoreductase n=1 Tax=Pedobacter chitinilyticus TaxID=2233776 RepID=A0A3S3PXK9_9SPHI|nr:SDR family oxidoreductase [Pedobacter chitinilyticus]RWU04394.1 SDR family oxidoreductase [Pedobacter chitinilyticus]
MDLQLKNKVILVSGGAKGIGNAICRVLASENAIPIIIGRSEADNLKLEAEIINSGGKCGSVVAELSDPNDCQMAISKVIAKYQQIDGLVNNAGLNDGVSLENGNYQQFMDSVHRNLVHYYLLAHYSLPYLKQSKGSIVNIASKTGVTGQGETSGYAASNGARNALTREWAVELLKYDIRVNAVIVAESWTPQYERWIQTLPDAEAKLKEINARIPLQNRMTEPTEIANTVAFLLSNKSSHTTGQLIYVDGGYVHLDRALLHG